MRLEPNGRNRPSYPDGKSRIIEWIHVDVDAKEWIYAESKVSHHFIVEPLVHVRIKRCIYHHWLVDVVFVRAVKRTVRVVVVVPINCLIDYSRIVAAQNDHLLDQIALVVLIAEQWPAIQVVK